MSIPVKDPILLDSNIGGKQRPRTCIFQSCIELQSGSKFSIDSQQKGPFAPAPVLRGVARLPAGKDAPTKLCLLDLVHLKSWNESSITKNILGLTKLIASASHRKMRHMETNIITMLTILLVHVK